MNKQSKITIGIVVVSIVVALGYWFLRVPAPVKAPTAGNPSAPQPISNSQQTNQTPAPSEPARNIIVYTDQRFSPSTITIKAGGSVTWTNNSSEEMWIASAIHPTHAIYSGTTLSQHCPDTTNSAFDECGGVPPGQNWTFTFSKAGAWKYHNHLDPGETGAVIVQ